MALCLACAARPQGTVLATVDGQAITQPQVDAERAFLQPDPPDDDDILDDLIDQALILAAARHDGVTLDAQARQDAELQARAGTDLGLLKASLAARGIPYEQWVLRVHRAALINAMVRQQMNRLLIVSPQEVQDRYWERLPAYRSPEKRVLSQIFTHKHGDADKARRELELGEPFASVARRRGEGPEAAQGGALGPQELKQLPKALAHAAAALKPGHYSPLLHSPWGWHILYLQAKLPAVSETLEQASPEARAALWREKEQPVYQAWLAQLREKASIKKMAAPAATPVPKGR